MNKLAKKILMGILTGALFIGAKSVQAVSLNGAGATFPYPIYSKWFFEYNQKTGVQVNYQSIGSGGGVQQFTAKTVDFGASDAFLTPEETAKLNGKVIHVPTVIGAVCVAYNVPGLETGVKLTGKTVADIFLGKITKWNDSAIADLNPGVSLPDVNITVAHRSDGSGTTNIFTNYLAKVSTEWAGQVGWGKAVKWPTGNGGKGNEGVAGLISQIPGTVGFVELAYAKQNKMSVAHLRNKAGKFVEPTVESTTAAAAGALKKMPPDFKVMITNAAGAGAYPICGFTWLLLRPEYDAVQGKALVDLLNWIYTDGEGEVESLYYAPLPDSLINKIKTKFRTIKF